MRPLSYARVADVDSAIAAVTRNRDGAFLAGGTTEVIPVRSTRTSTTRWRPCA